MKIGLLLVGEGEEEGVNTSREREKKQDTRAESRECWNYDRKSYRVGGHDTEEEGGYSVSSGDQVEWWQS